MLKVGLCGFGSMAKGHARMMQNHQDVTLAAIADPQPEARAMAAELYPRATIYETGAELIDREDIDVVFVVVPTYLHAELTIRALNRGRHVFCEKPMALTPEDCQKMADAASSNGKFLMVGHVLRFWPEYIFLHNAVKSGEYGKLIALSMTRVGNVSIGWERWHLDEDRGGSQLFDRHIHDCDAVLWMLGTPRSVYTYGANRDTKTQGGTIHNFTEYTFDDGLVVSAEGSADAISGFPFTSGYRAFFEKGVIEFNSRLKPTLQVFAGGEPFAPDMNSSELTFAGEMNISSATPHFNEQVYFFDCIRKNTPPSIITPAMGKETIRVILAEMQSAKEHRPVTL